MIRCRNCRTEITWGVIHPDHPDPDVGWFHTDHGGVTCGYLAPDYAAEFPVIEISV